MTQGQKKLNVLGLTIAAAITWAIAVCFVGFVSMLGWGGLFVNMLGSIYVGFEPTFMGVLIGTLWALIDGAIAGLVFSLLYNAVSRSKK